MTTHCASCGTRRTDRGFDHYPDCPRSSSHLSYTADPQYLRELRRSKRRHPSSRLKPARVFTIPRPSYYDLVEEGDLR